MLVSLWTSVKKESASAAPDQEALWKSAFLETKISQMCWCAFNLQLVQSWVAGFYSEAHAVISCVQKTWKPLRLSQAWQVVCENHRNTKPVTETSWEDGQFHCSVEQYHQDCVTFWWAVLLVWKLWVYRISCVTASQLLLIKAHTLNPEIQINKNIC